MRFALIWLFVFSEALAGQVPEHVVFVIDTHGSDQAAHGNLDYDDGYVLHNLEKVYPESNYRLIQADSNAEINRELKVLTRSPVIVDELYVLSHGESSEKNFHLVSSIENEKKTFHVMLEDPAQVKAVFGPLVGKFAPGAKIVFEGCSLAEAGATIDKFRGMKSVADNFGLKTGRIYMNTDPGSTFIRGAYGTPFYEQVGLRKFPVLAMDMAGAVLLPLFYVGDYWAFNRGVTLDVENGESKLFRDNRMNAETSYISTAEEKHLEPMKEAPNAPVSDSAAPKAAPAADPAR